MLYPAQIYHRYTRYYLPERRCGSDFFGAFRAPKTIAHTPTMPAPPMLYATSRPAHQYNVQKSSGPPSIIQKVSIALERLMMSSEACLGMKE